MPTVNVLWIEYKEVNDSGLAKKFVHFPLECCQEKMEKQPYEANAAAITLPIGSGIIKQCFQISITVVPI